MIKSFYIMATILLLFFSDAAIAKDSKNVSSIKAQMIQESIDSYSGNCPCPYNYARNGSKCGKRSAWSKPGGYAPLCYESDITNEMVDAYLKK